MLQFQHLFRMIFCTNDLMFRALWRRGLTALRKRWAMWLCKYPFLLSGRRAQPSDVFYFLWVERERGVSFKMSKWSQGNRKWYSLCGFPCDSSFYVVFHSTSEGTGGILAWEYSRHTSLTDGGKLRPKRSKMGGGCIRRLQGILAVCFIYFISLYCIVLHFKYFILLHFL